MENLPESHLDLKIAEEFVQFEKVFLEVRTKNKIFDVKVKVITGELKQRLKLKTPK